MTKKLGDVHVLMRLTQKDESKPLTNDYQLRKGTSDNLGQTG